MPTRWNNAAKIRRKQIEDGTDITFNSVFKPYFENIVGIVNPGRILEIGAGTGHLAKHLAGDNGDIEYIAIEPSPGMHETAVDVLKSTPVIIENSQIQNLSKTQKFDLIISHLCVHVIDDIDSLFSITGDLLQPHGTFVFTIPHPCFYNEYKNLFLEHEYSYMRQNFKEIELTLSLDQSNAITGVPYHHRPLSKYINTLSSNSLVTQKLDEIYPPPEVQSLYGVQWETPRYCGIWSKLDR